MTTESMTMNTPENSDEVGIDVQRLVRRCDRCRHFGQLKGIAGVVRATVCLAPADEGERFVYETSPHEECELFTPNVQADSPNERK